MFNDWLCSLVYIQDHEKGEEQTRNEECVRVDQKIQLTQKIDFLIL
jgi:hypothetical protein